MTMKRTIIQLPIEMFEEIRQIAYIKGVSISELIREAIKLYIINKPKT